MTFHRGISVLICRCLISLRQVRLRDTEGKPNPLLRFVGNAGAPLRIKLRDPTDDPVEEEESEDEDEVVYVTENPLMAGLLPNNDNERRAIGNAVV